MPNTITLAKNFTNLLDEVYQNASVTADLTGDASMCRAGANVNEISYPQIETSGLGDYDRNSGYAGGTVSLEWRTTKFNYDRGTKISVDTMDNEETYNLAFGMAGSTLIRTKVAPEADAFTFATLAGTPGIGVATPATYSDASDFLTALLAAKNKMDEDEVPAEGRILYATPTLLNSVMALDTTKSKEALHAFSVVKSVPQTRFYTAIDMLDGKSTGEELGHYKKAAAKYVKAAEGDSGAKKVVADSASPSANEIKVSAVTPCAKGYTPKAGDYVVQTEGKELNFMIVHKPAIIKFDKHIANDVISPANNPDSDAYILKYRKYGLVDVYRNKVAGIYISHKA